MRSRLEALPVECFLTSPSFGAEETVIASLEETVPPMDQEKFAGYLIGRVVQDARRRNVRGRRDVLGCLKERIKAETKP